MDHRSHATIEGSLHAMAKPHGERKVELSCCTQTFAMFECVSLRISLSLSMRMSLSLSLSLSLFRTVCECLWTHPRDKGTSCDILFTVYSAMKGQGVQFMFNYSYPSPLSPFH